MILQYGKYLSIKFSIVRPKLFPNDGFRRLGPELGSGRG
jgi:hypothetical protein